MLNHKMGADRKGLNEGSGALRHPMRDTGANENHAADQDLGLAFGLKTKIDILLFGV